VGRAAPEPSGAEATPTVVVVGGGITGLAAAWALATAPAAGIRVVVLESEERLGGKLHSAEIDGQRVDVGPDAFLARRPEARALCGELGLEDELVAPGSRRAYVFARGRLRALPAGLALGVPTRLGPLARSGILSPAGLARAALDVTGWHPGAPDRAGTGPGGADADDVAVGAAVRQRLGAQVASRLADPLIGGIHAGPTDAMSSAAVFPALLAAVGRGGSLMRALRAGAPGPGGGAGGDAPVFLTVRGGLGLLVDRLAAALRARGADVRTHWPVERLGPPDAGNHAAATADARAAPARWAVTGPAGTIDAHAVVLAVPAGAAARLLAPLDARLGEQLREIAYGDVTIVTLRLADDAVGRPLDATGFLVPAEAGWLVTASTWLSSKWPQLRRPGAVLLRASMGRYGDDRAAQLSDDEVVARAVSELRGVLALRGAPTASQVTRWPASFPQYAVGHLARVAAIEAGVARHPGLALGGAALRGVGIPACIGSGRRAAEAVLGHLGAVAQGVR